MERFEWYSASEFGTAYLTLSLSRLVRYGFCGVNGSMSRNCGHNGSERIFNGREGTPAEGHTTRVKFNHLTNNLTF